VKIEYLFHFLFYAMPIFSCWSPTCLYGESLDKNGSWCTIIPCCWNL